MESGTFPTTIWSQVRLGGASGGAVEGSQGHGGARDGARDEALAELARRYQGPAEAFLRAALRQRPEEAHELFQEFFVWMLESGFLAKADPERGRFRAFLKVALRRFASDELRRAGAVKRGGGQAHVALDATNAPELADPGLRPPEDLLDESWRAALVDEAFERLRTVLEARGRGQVFAVFRDYYFAPGPEPDYRVLAERHGCTTTDVSNWLQRAKKAFRTELRELVLDTVRSPEQLGDELTWLLEGS